MYNSTATATEHIHFTFLRILCLYCTYTLQYVGRRLTQKTHNPYKWGFIIPTLVSTESTQLV